MSEQLSSAEQQIEIHAEGNGEPHLLDFLIVLGRHRKLVIGLPIVTGLAAMIVSLLMTPIFTSTTTILPPQQQGSGMATAMLGQLGGLAAASSIAGLKNPNDLYIGMLESRTVADALISRFKLKERYKVVTMDDARLALAKVSDIASSKRNDLISISVFDKDPEFAADLANAYVDELTNLTKTRAVTDASRRRLFFEKQLAEAKNQLTDAEVALRKTQEKTGMIEPDAQVQAIISTAAQLKATIASKEVEIAAMRVFATDQNPDILRTREELRGLQAQLNKLEKNEPSNKGSDFMVPTRKLPEVGVEYVRRLRDVKYYETLFDLLAKQYEIARIDEARDSSMIQQLDKAVPAERKSKPKRAQITIIGLIGGTLLGVLFAFLRELYTSSRRDPNEDIRWRELAMVWKSRRT